MANHKRFLGELFSGLIALGGAADSSPVEKPKMEDARPLSDSLLRKERGGDVNREVRIELDPIFRAEHPIEAELQSLKNDLPKEKRESFEKKISHALQNAEEYVRGNLYKNPKDEQKYFSACYETEQWGHIKETAAFVSEKTGMPADALLAMGFIETQFDERAEHIQENENNSAFGTHQFTVRTAQRISKRAKAMYGFEIPVNSKEDLFNTKTSLLLAGLLFHENRGHYGQDGLAIATHASSNTSVEHLIESSFPVDLGTSDWKKMETLHAQEVEFHDAYNALTEQYKSGDERVSKSELRLAYKKFEDTANAYKKVKASWKGKRAQTSKILRDAGVNLATLHARLEKKGDVPFFITYAFAVDGVAKTMRKQEEVARGTDSIIAKE